MDSIRRFLLSVIPAYILAACLASPAPPLVGIWPQDAKYFEKAVIWCKDGTKSFTKDRLNDDFCDCVDGTDEPGTSACPEGRFYCRNSEDMPRILFSSQVNDGICDCCDGSDEYDGGTSCLNTCHKKEEFLDDRNNDYSNLATVEHGNVQDRKSKLESEDLIQKLEGLKVVTMIEVVFAMCLIAFCVLHRCGRTRRRHYLRT